MPVDTGLGNADFREQTMVFCRLDSEQELGVLGRGLWALHNAFPLAVGVFSGAWRASTSLVRGVRNCVIAH